MIRHMERRDEKVVRALTALAHPDWAPKPRGWYRTEHRTLVAEEGGAVVGYTTYGFTATQHAYGRDVVVHPAWRGKGLGGQLHGARLLEAQARGASHFVGVTPESDVSMTRILESWGGLKTTTTTDGVAYVNGLGGA